MPLPAGTALQDGDYILDGIYHEDALGLMYLATHVPSGQVMQVRCLPSHHRDAEVWQRLSQQITALGQQRHPHIIAPLTCFYEQGYGFVVMAADVGQPLSVLVTPERPLSAPQSVTYVQQVAAGLAAISQAGPFVVDIGPAHIWCHPGHDRVVLSGLGLLPPEMKAASEDETGASAGTKAHRDIAALARLFYFCLTGEAVTATRAPDVRLKQRRPDLPAAYGQAIHRGLQAPPDQVETWLAEVVAAAKQSQPPPLPVPAAPAAPNGPGFRRYPALLATAVAAAFVGGGIGLALRLLPLAATGHQRLNPAQSFPSLSDWSSTEGDVDFDSPYLDADQRPLNRAEDDLAESELEWSEETEEAEAKALESLPPLTPFSADLEAPDLDAAERLSGEQLPPESEAAPVPEPSTTPSPETEVPPTPSSPGRTEQKAPPENEREVTDIDESSLYRDSTEPQLRSHPSVPAEDTSRDELAKSAIKLGNNLNRDS